MSLFSCPICSAPLRRTERAYLCPAGHSYDIAREGHTHLLPANRKHSKMPGDDKETLIKNSFCKVTTKKRVIKMQRSEMSTPLQFIVKVGLCR